MWFKVILVEVFMSVNFILSLDIELDTMNIYLMNFNQKNNYVEFDTTFSTVNFNVN